MKVRLKDYVELVSDKTKNNKDIDSYVSTENLLSDKQGVRFPATSVSNSKYIQTYRKDDVLISNIRPYFKKIWKAERSGTHSNDVLCFRSKTDSLLQNFLYIILQSDRFFEFVSKNSKGTKMPRGDKKAIMQYEFELPSLSEQIKISNQVLSFEDKVLLNNQINDNLVVYKK